MTVRDVAAAAGVSNGTLYHSFSSRDELFLAVATRAASVQQHALGDPAGGIVDVIMRLFVDIEAAVEIVRALAEGFQLRAASDTLTADADRFVTAVLDAILTAWFAERSDAGVVNR